ncbi:DUF2256 domain-containing protein [Paraburkholderia bryophila]|uniref:DUF2256 domain-containing protein n=1 Tax=Paraburkholderia bryophila TaxID=420952 RepID=UPI00234AD421|nr:DUF2256 domain-containing protein [Paraburkholderia bryophila]WCM18290.1 DUF2256 domain-containing protein [Paraburkholderia bryophila]
MKNANSSSGVQGIVGQHRGNKTGLPVKLCVACGLPMSWRRRWARNWSEVKYCSDACRRREASHG